MENLFRDSANSARTFSWRTLNHEAKPDEREVGIDRVLPPTRGIPVSVHRFLDRVRLGDIWLKAKSLVRSQRTPRFNMYDHVNLSALPSASFDKSS